MHYAIVSPNVAKTKLFVLGEMLRIIFARAISVGIIMIIAALTIAPLPVFLAIALLRLITRVFTRIAIRVRVASWRWRF